jgi:CRP/FNR family cyclic AMP-dependent transcriptional regulator
MVAGSEIEKAFLRTVPIFGGLEDGPLDRILSLAHEVPLATGVAACAEGDAGRNMYVVREGQVEVLRTTASGAQVAMGELGVGDCFGEMTLIEMQPRSASVVATVPTRLLALGKADLFKLYQEDVHTYVLLLQNICRELARRLRKADMRIATLIEGTRP